MIYVILEASEAADINLNDVVTNKPRWNNDQSQTFVKYTGITPDWLVGKPSYTKAEMLEILNNPEGNWMPEEL